MIPQTFNGWTNCIVNDSKINLTKEFAEKRFLVNQNNKNSETQKFISLHSEQHLQSINWFKKIKND
jgi:hypothetical protein